MLEQGQLGAKDAAQRGGVVVAAPQGKLGAAISCPLAHLESLSSTTINPWWAQELFLLPLMMVGTGDPELHRVPQGPSKGLDHEAKLSQLRVDLAPRD